MLKSTQLKQLMLACFIGAFIILFHQYANWGKWFEISDIHHETFAVALAFGGILLYGILKTKRK